ncbi:MAG: hypothetical protein ACXQT4_00805 [Methanotrichaceae archaeon]
MKLKGFIDDAYKGKVRKKKRLEKRTGDFVLGFEDFAERLGKKPTRSEVEYLAPSDLKLLVNLISTNPAQEKRDQTIWGFLTSLAAERSSEPIVLTARDFAGLELKKGTIVLNGLADHVGERMAGGKIIVNGRSGHYLGQEMTGGGIVANSCGDYAFRNMKGGWGVIKGNAGNYLGVGNSGGRIVVKANAGSRTGWLMHSGRIYVRKNAGDYLGMMMSNGSIAIGGRAGQRTGWRMKGGTILARGYGPEVGAGKVGGNIFRKKTG